jgi:CubicO group peptidase (beta-lactamase class C family)
MSQRFAAILFAFLGATLLERSFAQTPNETSERKIGQELQAYFDSLAAEDHLSGAVLVARNGTPIASKAAGMANRATGVPNTLETKFNLGSCNKMFTAVAIAQLAQKGLLQFDDAVDKHLPDFPNREVAGKITIHQLLTHTSGLGSYMNDNFAAMRAQLTTVAAHLPLIASDSLAFNPGEKFQYSNSGYMLLGAIIEKLSGQDYYDYVRENIFQPAGMSATGFYDSAKQPDDVAIGYTKMDAGGGRSEIEKENTNLREVRGGPAGGGYSTVGDLLKFHLALRDHKLLDEERTNLVTTGKVEAPSPIGKYAYGFGDKIFAGKHIVGHNGGFPGIAANFEMYPEIGYTAIILMNSDPPAMMPVIMKIREILPAGEGEPSKGG